MLFRSCYGDCLLGRQLWTLGGLACFAMRRMDDTEPFFSPRRTRMLSMGLPALSASVTALRPAMTSLSLSFSMNKPIPFRGFRTRLRPKFAILSQYIVDYSILIFAIATETRNLARFLQAVFAPKTAVFLRSEERRVGKECRIGCRSRWSPYH